MTTEMQRRHHQWETEQIVNGIFGPHEDDTRVRISEADSIQHWVELLSGHFSIEHEVPGESPRGRKYRLDMLLHPHFEWPSGGRNPIGFEIKRPDRDVATFTKALAQAADYAHAEWFSARSAQPLRVYVAIFDAYTQRCCRDVRLTAERIAGRLNVAMIRLDKDLGVTLTTSGELRWSLVRGRTGAAFSAIPKDGSR